VHPLLAAVYARAMFTKAKIVAVALLLASVQLSVVRDGMAAVTSDEWSAPIARR